ncbi:MAG TPA: hypothetical protein VF139_08135 [Candidatus Polarisedimenticolaceae bacterium]
MLGTTLRANASRLLVAGSAALFVAVFLRNTWIVDDAFITFRVIDNFVHGLGLTWNPGERVQVFTHPLWMFVMTGVHAVTREFLVSTLATSLAACLAALEVARRSFGRAEAAWRLALVVGIVVSSKTVADYTSSGLENALAYLIVAAFVLQAGRVDEAPTPRGVAILWTLASLAFLNRHDAVLLCLPAAGWLTWRSAVTLGRTALLAAALGCLPGLLWVAFATFYFGFPLPNTYYAKAAVELPLDLRLRRGYAYFGNSLAWDTLSHLGALGAAWLAYLRRDRVAAGVLAGCAVYAVFILLNASATHMAGRLFSVPFFLAFLVLARLWPSRRSAVALGAALAVFNLAAPMAPWKMGGAFYRLPAQHENHIDTNALVHREGPHVSLGRSEAETLAEHPWFASGLQFRLQPERIHVGGPRGGEPIGFFGFAAGPAKHVVDYCALTDPLLSHLPTCVPAPRRGWKSGHFYRTPPEGYLESLATGENRIADPTLHAFYEDLRLATRSPELWSGARLRAIWRLQTEGVRAARAAPPGSCRALGSMRGPVRAD